MGHKETFLGDENVLYHDYGSGYMTIHLSKLIVHLKLVNLIEYNCTSKI